MTNTYGAAAARVKCDVCTTTSIWRRQVSSLNWTETESGLAWPRRRMRVCRSSEKARGLKLVAWNSGDGRRAGTDIGGFSRGEPHDRGEEQGDGSGAGRIMQGEYRSASAERRKLCRR